MAQNLATDFPINAGTTSGTQLADILNRFQAAQNSGNSGAAQPPVTYAGMVWLDLSAGGNGVLKLRDQANAAWVTVLNTAAPPITAGSGTFTAKVTVAPPAGTDAELWLQGPATRVAALRMAGNGQAINAQSLDLFQDAGSVGHLMQRAAQPLVIYTAGAERARYTATGMGVTGTLAVTGAMTATTTINATGAITSGATVTGAGVQCNGNLGVTGTGYFGAGSAGSPSIAFGVDAGTGLYRSGGGILGIATSGAERLTIAPGLSQFLMPVRADSFTYRGDASFGMFVSAPFYVYGWSGNSHMRFNTGNGDWDWISGSTNVMTMQAAGGNLLWRTGTAAKPGGGPWVDVSDARTKQDVRDYEAGLPQVLQLRPRRFRFNEATGRDTTREYVGLIAQEAQPAMPEMVSTVAAGSVQGEGHFAGFDPNTQLLQLDTSALAFALVNAVKELHARITQLEATQ